MAATEGRTVAVVDARGGSVDAEQVATVGYWVDGFGYNRAARLCGSKGRLPIRESEWSIGESGVIDGSVLGDSVGRWEKGPLVLLHLELGSGRCGHRRCGGRGLGQRQSRWLSGGLWIAIICLAAESQAIGRESGRSSDRRGGRECRGQGNRMGMWVDQLAGGRGHHVFGLRTVP